MRYSVNTASIQKQFLLYATGEGADEANARGRGQSYVIKPSAAASIGMISHPDVSGSASVRIQNPQTAAATAVVDVKSNLAGTATEAATKPAPLPRVTEVTATEVSKMRPQVEATLNEARDTMVENLKTYQGSLAEAKVRAETQISDRL
jgi:hypothetical protein